MIIEAPVREGIEPAIVIEQVQAAIDAAHVGYPLKSIELTLGTVTTRGVGGGFKLTVPILGEIGVEGEHAQDSSQMLTLHLTPRPLPKAFGLSETQLTRTLQTLGRVADDVRLAHPELDVAPTASVEFVVTDDASIKVVIGVEAKKVLTSKLEVAFDKAGV